MHLPENKPKREIIQTLVRRGYDSDPVKAWRAAQSKEKVHLNHVLTVIKSVIDVVSVSICFCLVVCVCVCVFVCERDKH